MPLPEVDLGYDAVAHQYDAWHGDEISVRRFARIEADMRPENSWVVAPRLTRWLAVLLFSVREPQLNDWLLVENALTRGRLMEVLGAQLLPGQPHDPLFLTGIFSCLDRLLRLHDA